MASSELSSQIRPCQKDASVQRCVSVKAILYGHLLLHYTNYRFDIGLPASQMGEGCGARLFVSLYFRINGRLYINTRNNIRSATGD